MPIPNHQSSFYWICLPLLTLSIIRSSCPPWHHWDSTSLVWILPHWSVFQGGLGRVGIQSTSIGHWGSPGLGSWTPPLLHIHYITGSHHTGTWLLLPFLRWWYTALSLISTRWSNGSCTDLRLLGRHLGMDERTSPTAQPGKTELLVFPATPTLQHDFSIQLGSSTITPSVPVRNLGVNFDDQLASTNDSECSGTTGLQRAQKSPCYISLCLLTLATSFSSHQVQDTDACI